MKGELCRLLAEDPELAADLDPARRRTAEDHLLVRVVRLGHAEWPELAAGRLLSRPPAERGAGLLILDGLLLRRVGVSGRYGAELLGEGDLLRPWHGGDAEPTLAPEAAWRVLDECRLAVLDVDFLRRLAPFPELTGRLVERALRRSRQMAVLTAIVHQPRLEVRLHMLLWQLAGRWGTVGPGGVRLALRLSHSMLAELVAARRPSVTSALGRLAEQGLVRDEMGGWRLIGDPPAELLTLGAIVETDPPLAPDAAN